MQDLVAVYNKVRKVPYKIVDINYSLESSYDLINNNGASCTPKHIVLADQLNKMGYATRFCLHEFNWADLNIKYSDHMLNLLSMYPGDIHTNLEMKIDDQWIMIDATWDDHLIHAGLPGTLSWNGKESTINNVIPLRTYRFSSLKERNDYLETRKEALMEDNKIRTELAAELNRLLADMRNGF